MAALLHEYRLNRVVKRPGQNFEGIKYSGEKGFMELWEIIVIFEVRDGV